MQNNIKYSPRAIKDLEEIMDYIKIELCNPKAAQTTIDGILNKVDEPKTFPYIGTKLGFDDGLDSGYRYVIFKKYMAFYHIRTNDEICVDRVIYSGRDYIKLLFPKL